MTKEEQCNKLSIGAQSFLIQLDALEHTQKEKLDPGVWPMYKNWIDDVRQDTRALISALENAK